MIEKREQVVDNLDDITERCRRYCSATDPVALLNNCSIDEALRHLKDIETDLLNCGYREVRLRVTESDSGIQLFLEGVRMETDREQNDRLHQEQLRKLA